MNYCIVLTASTAALSFFQNSALERESNPHAILKLTLLFFVNRFSLKMTYYIRKIFLWDDVTNYLILIISLSRWCVVQFINPMQSELFFVNFSSLAQIYCPQNL